MTWGANILQSSNPVISFSCLVLKAMAINFLLGRPVFPYTWGKGMRVAWTQEFEASLDNLVRPFLKKNYTIYLHLMLVQLYVCSWRYSSKHPLWVCYLCQIKFPSGYFLSVFVLEIPFWRMTDHVSPLPILPSVFQNPEGLFPSRAYLLMLVCLLLLCYDLSRLYFMGCVKSRS